MLALYEDGPLEVGPSDLALLDVFALRAGAALERLRDQPLAERLERMSATLSGVRLKLNSHAACLYANLRYLGEELARPDASVLDLTELREVVGEATEVAERLRTVVRDYLMPPPYRPED